MSEAARNSYFDKEASAWTHRYSSNQHFQARLAIALSWLPQQPTPLDLVDFGCGSGVLMRKLLERGHAVTGIDASAHMLEEAKRNISAGGTFLGRYELFQAEEFNMSGGERKWDGIFCLGVIEYFDDPVALLRQFAHALRPGGFLLLSYPNNLSILRRVERAVFRYPGVFRALGVFPHLTGENSYLRVQRHQFAYKRLEEELSGLGLVLSAHAFHVSPGWLRALASNPAIGMTAISSYRKAS